MFRLLIALDDRVPAANAQVDAVEDVVSVADEREVWVLHVFATGRYSSAGARTGRRDQSSTTDPRLRSRSSMLSRIAATSSV
ncbi:hypothetical protein BRC95_11365 [Halobacteriales archaeon QS_5_68_33]|nr:MAG: hypothetical protein BRC95_11365 [Halobacteriales archaeon QS_5_68_33]